MLFSYSLRHRRRRSAGEMREREKKTAKHANASASINFTIIIVGPRCRWRAHVKCHRKSNESHLNSIYSKEKPFVFLCACQIPTEFAGINNNDNECRTHRGKDARNANLFFKNKQKTASSAISSSAFIGDLSHNRFYFDSHRRLRRVLSSLWCSMAKQAAFTIRVRFFCF